jgi:hypothetical protein
MDIRLQLLCARFRISQLLLQLVLYRRAAAFPVGILRDDVCHPRVGLILQAGRQPLRQIQHGVAERAFACDAALLLIQPLGGSEIHLRFR